MNTATRPKVFQDGGRFYDDETGDLVADYRYMLHDDPDMDGERKAAANFQTMHPEYELI